MMLRSHASFCAIDISSPIRQHVPLWQHNGRQASHFNPHQLKVIDLQFTRSFRSPRSRGVHAVCFKDEVPSHNFVTSSVHEDISRVPTSETSISCTTFNILAPIYKRVNGEDCRESDIRELWLVRNQKIIDFLLLSSSSIVCLQEFWLGNEELTRLYDSNFSQADYVTYKLARTNSRGDERKNMHIADVARALMSEKNISPCFWAETASIVAYTMNMILTAAVHDMTPREKFTGKKPDVSHFTVFGCIAYVHVPEELRTKLDLETEKCVDYSVEQKGYKCYNRVTR
ncbi:hypothetical protein L7F22_030501 [Adiantum nelumboides]|nr:hypothetical protein [Adiantum nelumboides]